MERNRESVNIPATEKLWSHVDRMQWWLCRWNAKMSMEMERIGDYDAGMQEWVMEMDCTGDYDDGMQKWGRKMECSNDYDMECKSEAWRRN